MIACKAGLAATAAFIGAICMGPAGAGKLFAAPAACAADQAWADRYATFARYTLASDVEAALKGDPQ